MASAFLIAGASGMLGTALQRVLNERDAAVPGSSGGRLRHLRRGRGSPPNDRVRGVSARWRSGRSDQRRRLHQRRACRGRARAGVPRQRDRRGESGTRRPRRWRWASFTCRPTSSSMGASRARTLRQTSRNPLSVYGASKLAGEQAVSSEHSQALIVRTAWVFGAGGVNFPLKVIQAARERGRLSVVTDEVGSPTYTIDLAKGILGLVNAGEDGLFHLVGSGSCSRYELAVEAAPPRLLGRGGGTGSERGVHLQGCAPGQLGSGLLACCSCRGAYAQLARRPRKLRPGAVCRVRLTLRLYRDIIC